jgi:hypothetical protein
MAVAKSLPLRCVFARAILSLDDMKHLTMCGKGCIKDTSQAFNDSLVFISVAKEIAVKFSRFLLLTSRLRDASDFYF